MFDNGRGLALAWQLGTLMTFDTAEGDELDDPRSLKETVGVFRISADGQTVHERIGTVAFCSIGQVFSFVPFSGSH